MSEGEEEDDVRGLMAAEFAGGTIQCNHCDYWGDMKGYIDPESPKTIMFLCPECDVIERVVNPLAQ